MSQCTFLSTNENEVQCFNDCVFFNYEENEGGCPFKNLTGRREKKEKGFFDFDVFEDENFKDMDEKFIGTNFI